MFRRSLRSLRHNFQRRCPQRVKTVSQIDGVEVTCQRQKMRPGDTTPPRLQALLEITDTKIMPRIFYRVDVSFKDRRPIQTYYIVPVNRLGSHAVGGLGAVYGARTVFFDRVTVSANEKESDPWLSLRFQRENGTAIHGFPVSEGRSCAIS